MGKIIQVFVSSTSDLADERRSIKDKLKEENGDSVKVWLYEEEEAVGFSPEDYCRQQIEQSEIFICILGGKYGSLYPPEYQGSIVEFEYEESRRQLPPHLTGVFVKKLPNDEIESKQQDFRKRISKFDGIWIKTYESVEELTSSVVKSIRKFFADNTLLLAENNILFLEFLHKVTHLSTIIFILIAVLSVLVFFLFDGIRHSTLYALCVLGVGILLKLGVNYLCKSITEQRRKN